MSRTRKPPKESPSKQLRNVFYGIYQQKQPMVTFEEYYEEQMTKLVSKYKQILNKLKDE